MPFLLLAGCFYPSRWNSYRSSRMGSSGESGLAGGRMGSTHLDSHLTNPVLSWRLPFSPSLSVRICKKGSIMNWTIWSIGDTWRLAAPRISVCCFSGWLLNFQSHLRSASVSQREAFLSHRASPLQFVCACASPPSESVRVNLGTRASGSNTNLSVFLN